MNPNSPSPAPASPTPTPAPVAPAPPVPAPTPPAGVAPAPPVNAPAKFKAPLLISLIVIILVLIALFVVVWVLYLSPQAQSKRLSGRFMSDITQGNITDAVSLTGDPTSKDFLTTASSKLQGSYSLAKSSFKNGTGYYLYNMSGAQDKYARTIVGKSNGKREVTSLVYDNSPLALIPGNSSTSSNTPDSGSSPKSSSSSTTTTSYSTYTNDQFHFSFKYPSSWGTVAISQTTGTQSGASGVSSYNGTFSDKSGSSYINSGSSYPYLFQINSFKWSAPNGSDGIALTQPTLAYRVIAGASGSTDSAIAANTLNWCERTDDNSEVCNGFSSLGDWITINDIILAKEEGDTGVALFVPLQTLTGDNYPTMAFYSNSMSDYSAFQEIAQSFQGQLTGSQTVN